MKHKFLTVILILGMVLFNSSIIFALDEPEKPVIDESNPEASNELIEQYNQEVDDYNQQAEDYNAQVDSDYEEAYAEYEEEVAKVEKNNTFVENTENDVTEDTSEAQGFENNTTDSSEMPNDWNDETTEELKTIKITSSETPSGETVKVINVHVYLDEYVDFAEVENTFYNSLEDDSFELSNELTNHAILTEWETAEMDYDDTVTVQSEAEGFAGNIAWINGKRAWLGASPSPYFIRSLDGYTQGYWISDASMIASTATETSSGWAAGTTYEAKYAEKTVSSNYLYNGQLRTENIQVRTTDRQAPKNIFSLFTYVFYRLAEEPILQELPEEPEKGEYIELLAHMDLLDVPEPEIPEVPTEPEPEPEPIAPEEPVVEPVVEPEVEPVVAPTRPRPRVEQNTTPQVETTPTPTETAKTTITNEPKPTTTITPEPTPAAATGSWALINLIATILSCIIAILLLFATKKTDEDEEELTEEEEKDIKAIKRFKIYSIIVAIISVIAFILTEDMRLPMVLTDKWTLLMLLLLIIEGINTFIIRQKSEEEDND